MGHRYTAEQRHRWAVELLYRCEEGISATPETVKAVAAQLGIKHTLAYELLTEVRRTALLYKTVLVPPPDRDPLVGQVAAQLERDGVKQVVIVPTPADDRQLESPQYRSAVRRGLGAAAARYVMERCRLRAGDHVCIDGGRTSMAFAEHFMPPVADLVFRPLAIGGRWRAVSHTDASAVLQYLYWRLVSATGGARETRVRVVCPEAPPSLVGTLGDTRVARRYPEITAVLGPKSPRPQVVLTSLSRRRYVPARGKLGPHPDTSAFVQFLAEGRYYLRNRSRLTPEALFAPLEDSEYAQTNHELFSKGVVGDLCRHSLRADGSEVPGFLDTIACSVPLRTLREWREGGASSILVCGGSRSVHVFRAAVATGGFTTSIIDTALAVQLVPRGERTGFNERIPSVRAPQELEPRSARDAFDPA